MQFGGISGYVVVYVFPGDVDEDKRWCGPKRRKTRDDGVLKGKNKR